jgi:hypothetical protein
MIQEVANFVSQKLASVEGYRDRDPFPPEKYRRRRDFGAKKSSSATPCSLTGE